MKGRIVHMLAATAFAAAAAVASCIACAGEQDAKEAPAPKGAAGLDHRDGKLRAGIQLGYSFPLSGLERDGDTLDLYGSWSQAVLRRGVVGALAPGAVDDPGKGAAVGVRWNQLLASGGGHESRLSLGADLRGYRATGPLQEIEPGNDVTVTPLSLNYSGKWTLDEASVSGALSLLHNVGGPHGRQDDITRLRQGASAGYSILRLAGQLTGNLPSDFQVRAGVRGQYTGDVLLPGEQFGGGGAGGGLLVRGFSDRALAHDSGLAANVELYSPELCSGIVRWNCRALLFYDKGYFRNSRDMPGELRSSTVRSVGIGLRMSISRDVDLQVDYGRVVRSSMVPEQDKNRLHVRIGMRW